MGQEDPLSSCFSLLRGSQLNYSLGQLECECLPVNEVPRFVKEEGAQMPHTELLLPEMSFLKNKQRAWRRVRAGKEKEEKKGFVPVDCVIPFPISSPTKLQQQNVEGKEKSIRKCAQELRTVRTGE